MDLGGTWRAKEADEELRRALPDPGFDDSDWPDIPVPGQWQSVAALSGCDGPLLYRRRFSCEAPVAGERRWLTFEGMFYQADVWLDGSYLGDTEGYFAPHTFEITDHLAARDEHLLAVEVACAPEPDRMRKHNLTGVFQDWDCIDPSWNPGGIWGGVHIRPTGPVRLSSVRVLCREASDERAALEIEARIDSKAARTVVVTTTVTRQGSSAPATTTTSTPRLAAGDNRVRWRVALERPALWWPRVLGDQPLYDLVVDVAADGETSDSTTVSTGLRRVQMQRWVTTVNGERIFLKGANFGPSRRALSEVTAVDVAADLEFAREAGLDLLRVHGHIATTDLYDQADRIGMLLWQDLPLQWGYGPVRRQAAAQARQVVDLLGHHPSVAMWCGHNEPLGTDRSAGPPQAGIVKRAARQAVPHVGALRLDRSVRRALDRSDGSRPVIAHSGVLPHPAGATDSHLYPGWYDGDPDLATLLARWPVLGRFVSEFGAQAVPSSSEFMDPERWPDLDWEHLADHHGLQKAMLDRWAPTGDHASFESWRDATQQHQAEVVRRCIETLRRLKYRPAGGFGLFFLADAQPAISWSVLDHRRVPKQGFAALKAACAPVIIVADQLAPAYERGRSVEAALHVVSDLRTPLAGMEAHATLAWPGGARSWRYGGAVAADACARIGRIAAAIPEAGETGRIQLDLLLTWEDDTEPGGVASVTNRYWSALAAKSS